MSDVPAARTWIVLVAAAMAALLAGGAEARQFVVDSQADAPDVSLGDGVCAAADGSCTLRAAVQDGNRAAGPNTITLPRACMR